MGKSMKNGEYTVKKCPVQFMDFVVIEDSLWYASNNFNGLFRTDLKNSVSYFIGCFPNELKYGINLYGGICCWGGKLVFAPFMAKNIAVYDIENDKFETYAMPEFEKADEFPDSYFIGMAFNQVSIFFLGNVYPVIMQLNMITRKVTAHFSWYGEFRKYGEDRGTFIFDRHIIQRENCFYATSRQNNVLLKYDMNNDRTYFYEIGDKSARYSALAFGADVFWTIDQEHNELLNFSYETGKVQKIRTLLGEGGNYDIVFCNECLWIFSKRFTTAALTYDMVYIPKNDQLKVLDLKKMHNGYGVVFAKKEGENIYCMYPDANCFYKMNYRIGELIIDKIEPQYDSGLYDIVYEMGKINGVFLEASFPEYCNTHTRIQRNINTFINYVLHADKGNSGEDAEGQKGKRIWSLVTGD